jgi:hypothetical protein
MKRSVVKPWRLMVGTSSSNSKLEQVKRHLARRLEREGERCLEFFSSLLPEQWEQEVYTEGAQWSVRQVLAHFISTERALRTLVEAIISGGEGAPQDFDIDRFNEAQVKLLDEHTPSSLKGIFREERESTLNLLEALEPEQTRLQGRHPYFGNMTVEQLLKWTYQHAQVHLREIRRFLSRDASD